MLRDIFDAWAATAWFLNNRRRRLGHQHRMEEERAPPRSSLFVVRRPNSDDGRPSVRRFSMSTSVSTIVKLQQQHWSSRHLLYCFLASIRWFQQVKSEVCCQQQWQQQALESPWPTSEVLSTALNEAAAYFTTAAALSEESFGKCHSPYFATLHRSGVIYLLSENKMSTQIKFGFETLRETLVWLCGSISLLLGQ